MFILTRSGLDLGAKQPTLDGTRRGQVGPSYPESIDQTNAVRRLGQRQAVAYHPLIQPTARVFGCLGNITRAENLKKPEPWHLPCPQLLSLCRWRCAPQWVYLRTGCSRNTQNSWCHLCQPTAIGPSDSHLQKPCSSSLAAVSACSFSKLPHPKCSSFPMHVMHSQDTNWNLQGLCWLFSQSNPCKASFLQRNQKSRNRTQHHRHWSVLQHMQLRDRSTLSRHHHHRWELSKRCQHRSLLAGSSSNWWRSSVTSPE